MNPMFIPLVIPLAIIVMAFILWPRAGDGVWSPRQARRPFTLGQALGIVMFTLFVTAAFLYWGVSTCSTTLAN